MWGKTMGDYSPQDIRAMTVFEFDHTFKYEKLPVPGQPGLTQWVRMPRRKRTTVSRNRDRALVRRVNQLEALTKRDVRALNVVLPTTVAAAGSVTSVCDIAQGDTTITRDGDRITTISVLLKGFLSQHANATGSTVRICLIRDKRGTTTFPTIANVFETLAEFTGNRNRGVLQDAQSRFDIIIDKFFTMNDGGVLSHQFSEYRKIGGKVIEFTGPAIDDQGAGALYIFLGTNETGSNIPTFSGTLTIKWYG